MLINFSMISMGACYTMSAIIIPQLRDMSDPLYMDKELGSWFG